MTAFLPRRLAAAPAFLAGSALALAPSPAAVAGAPPKLTVERINAEPSLSGALPTRLAWHPDGRRLTYLRRRARRPRSRLSTSRPGRRASSSTARSAEPLDGSGREPGSTAGATKAEPSRCRCRCRRRVAARRPDAAGAGRRRHLHRRRPHGRGARARADARGGGVRRGLAGRHEGRLRARERPLAGGRRERAPDAADEERLGDAAQRAARLGLRGGARLAHRTGVRVVARLAADRVPAARPVARAHASRSSTSSRCATRSRWQRYPKAGAPNAVLRLGVVGLGPDGTPGPERLVSFTPDDVYVLPQLGFTPDSRHVAFQHMNRAQNELELRLLPVPEAPDAPLGAAAHRAHRALEDVGQSLRRAALLRRRPPLPVGLRARRLGPRLRVRPRRRVPRRSRKGPWIVDAAGRASPAAAASSPSTSAPASSTSPPPRRTRGSGTSTARASTAPASAA